MPNVLKRNDFYSHSKIVEHNSYWPWDQEKFLHRIEVDGKWWYEGPSDVDEERGYLMMRNAFERGEVIQNDNVPYDIIDQDQKS